MAERSRSATHRSIRRHVIAGVGVVFLLAGGLGGWAATAEISGALIAPGALVVDTNVKKVQHPTGGVVGEVRAHDGDRVKAGDVLVRLDETINRANLDIVSKGLVKLYARKARLAAERDQADSVAIPKELSEQAESPEAAEALASERKLFDLRGAARSGQKTQLRQRAIQLHEEIGGIEAQQKAKAREIVLINRELEGVNDLWEKKLVPLNRVMNLEREATRLEGERGQLISGGAGQARCRRSSCRSSRSIRMSAAKWRMSCAISTARSANSSVGLTARKTNCGASTSARRRAAWCSNRRRCTRWAA